MTAQNISLGQVASGMAEGEKNTTRKEPVEQQGRERERVAQEVKGALIFCHIR